MVSLQEKSCIASFDALGMWVALLTAMRSE